MAQTDWKISIRRRGIFYARPARYPRPRHCSFNQYVDVGPALRLEIRNDAVDELQIDAAFEREMQSAIAVETRPANEFEIRVRTVQVGLFDAHLIAAIGKPDRSVVLKLDEIIIEGNLVYVRFQFNRIRLAQGSGNSEVPVHAAVPGELL